jgi:hypothetical protein
MQSQALKRTKASSTKSRTNSPKAPQHRANAEEGAAVLVAAVLARPELARETQLRQPP